MDSIVNFGKAICSTNYDASATSIVLPAAQFIKLPQTAPYNLVWWNHTDFPSPEDDSAVEIIRVTALNVGTYTLTVLRAQEGTAAVAHNTASKEYWLMNGITKAVMDAIQTAIDGKAATEHTHTKANITDFPISMPASDVSAWAKAATKPTYTNTEVGAAAASHTHPESEVVNLVTDLAGKVAGPASVTDNAIPRFDGATGKLIQGSSVVVDDSGNLDVGNADIQLANTTSDITGVIYKGADRFIHNFQHPTGGGAVPVGRNTFVGVNAGNFTMGSTATQIHYSSYNSAMGYAALNFNTTGNANSAMGYVALQLNTTGNANTAMGYAALNSNTTGSYNAAMGSTALQLNTIGNANVAMGSMALNFNTTGNANSAMGYAALQLNTTGDANAAMGSAALQLNTTGDANAAMGSAALNSNTTGNGNTAMGYVALNNVKPTSKAITAFVDYGGIVAGTVKATSVAHGLTGTVTGIRISGTTNYNELYTITVIDVDNFYFTDIWVATETGWWGKDAEGQHNIGIGSQAGDNITTGSNNIIIGSDIDAPSATGDNQLNIGNTIYGDVSAKKVGVNIAAPTSTLHVAGSLALPIATKTANYTATISDYTLLGDATSAGITITLPAASGCAGRIYNVKKIDSSVNTVTIDGNASETIDGTLTKVISTQYESVQIQSNGTTWFVI